MLAGGFVYEYEQSRDYLSGHLCRSFTEKAQWVSNPNLEAIIAKIMVCKPIDHLRQNAGGTSNSTADTLLLSPRHGNYQ